MNSNQQHPPDWDDRYKTNDLPWETGRHSCELEKVLKEFDIPRGRVLEIGCGTGNNAIFLAQQGFEVTAFDISPQAIKLAVAKAKQACVSVNFFAADIAHLPDLPNFSFVFDRGVYHTVRRSNLAAHLDLLRNKTDPECLYLTLAGNANEFREGERGPPRITVENINQELLPIMELVQLREIRFTPPLNQSGPGSALAWSILLRKKKV